MSDLAYTTKRIQTNDQDATIIRRMALNLQDLTDASTTFGGGQLVADTTLVSGTWRVLSVLADAKFHTLTGNVTGVANTTVGSAPVIPAGTRLTGAFTALKLHSGSVVAYV